MTGLTRASFLAGAAALAALPARALAQTAPAFRFGVGSVEANAQGYYAYEQGFFKNAGLNPELVQLRSGPAIAAAVAGGDLQFGVANVLSLGNAHLRKLPFVLVAPGALLDVSVPTTKIVVARNSPIRSAKDLNGKAVAGISVGGLDQLMLDAWIDQNGGDLSSIKYLELPPAQMAEALDQGRVAAAALNEPELSAAGDLIRVLAPGSDAVAKVFMQTAWFTTEDYGTKNAATCRRFAEAIVRAGVWGEANPVPAAGVLAKYLKQREPRARMHYARTLDASLIQPVYDAGLKYKFFASPVSASEMIWKG